MAPDFSANPSGFSRQRERMVRELMDMGIRNPAVLAAMGKVPRHLFLPEALMDKAYENLALPIGHRQTISQPGIVARMSELLEAEAGMSVLEVGTGSGYQTAVLAAMNLDLTIFTVERVPELYFAARDRLYQLGLRKLRTRLSDGTLGWEENAPYDRIIVTAGGPDVPQPLLDQLADPGILLIPVGAKRGEQRLVRVFKRDGKLSGKVSAVVAFVDLVGDHGW